MLMLENEIEGMFFKIGLKAYFSIQKDIYRLTIFDNSGEQYLLFLPKKNFNQITEYKKFVLDYTKNKCPELLL